MTQAETGIDRMKEKEESHQDERAHHTLSVHSRTQCLKQFGVPFRFVRVTSTHFKDLFDSHLTE